MRRHDRQITDENTINELIRRCQAIRLGLRDNEEIYMVPLHFAHSFENNQHVFYCHSAPMGRKIDLIKHTGYAAFEMDGGQELLPGDMACDYSSAYFSIIGTADASLVENMAEKEAALNLIMAHYTGKDQWEYKPAMLNAIAVIKLVARELTCKANRPQI